MFCDDSEAGVCCRRFLKRSTTHSRKRSAQTFIYSLLFPILSQTQIITIIYWQSAVFSFEIRVARKFNSFQLNSMRAPPATAEIVLSLPIKKCASATFNQNVYTLNIIKKSERERVKESIESKIFMPRSPAHKTQSHNSGARIIHIIESNLGDQRFSLCEHAHTLFLYDNKYAAQSILKMRARFLHNVDVIAPSWSICQSNGADAHSPV